MPGAVDTMQKVMREVGMTGIDVDHDEPEQLEERTGLPREEGIVETVGVTRSENHARVPDLQGVLRIALRGHPHGASPPDALFGSLRQSFVC